MRLFVLLACLVLTCSGYGNMVGAPREIPPEEDTFKTLGQELQRVTHKFNREQGLQNLHVVTKVLNATSQVVAGTKYTLFVEFSPTSCNTATSNDFLAVDTALFSADSCTVLGGESKVCKVTIWQRPWLGPDQSEIINIVDCSTKLT
uniref:Cystatin domain-containing protein n=1 Tax=Trichobilharzia regenti TaxID=157069 RepID=A0AA85K4I4_TRIRE|nr:unnamed protein product [Trichobilharzia regenti]